MQAAIGTIMVKLLGLASLRLQTPPSTVSTVRAGAGWRGFRAMGFSFPVEIG
jgi:hypothetical protein